MYALSSKFPGRTALSHFLFIFLFLFTTSAFAQLRVITVPYSQGNTSIPHYAYKGKPTTFKAIARGVPAGATVKYWWDFDGDGTYDTASAGISTTNLYNLSAQCDLSALPGYQNLPYNMTFSAVIKVTYGSETAYASYPVVLFANTTRDIKINVAVDDGLWWLHNYLTRTTISSIPMAYSKQTREYSSTAAPRRSARTAAIAWAMSLQGHIGDETKYDVDPYVEDVVRCLNYVFYRTQEATLSNQTYLGNPEAGVPTANQNGKYLRITQNSSGYDTTANIYDNSIVLATIASSGTPNKVAVAPSGNPTNGKTFKWIAQEFLDQLSFGQVDGGTGRGGWEYVVRNNSSVAGYSSLGLWAYLALEGAHEFGCHIPTNVKTELETFIYSSGIQITATGTDKGVFKYNSGLSATGRRNKGLTGGGMIAMNILGWSNPAHARHSRWLMAYECIARNWNTMIYTAWARDFNVERAYTRYSIMKGARTSSPEIVTFDYGANSYNWYNIYADEITSTQLADGSWALQDSNDTDAYLREDMVTVLNVLTLTRSLFDPTPEAIAKATPPSLTVTEGCSGAGAGNVTFSHAQSFHSNPARDIVSYEWDFDGDGIYDYYTTDKNAQVVHTYMYNGTYTATLKVTDNNTPAKTDTDSLTITVTKAPNSQPTANAGGPYVISEGDSITFNASLSQDPDAPCGDSIVSYQWDLDNDGQYDDGSGVTLAKTWAQLQAYNLSYPANRTTGLPRNTVKVRVTDQYGASNTASTTLTIYDNRPFAVGTATPSLASCNQTVNFNATASYHGHPQRSIVSYEWDFQSDGTWDATGVTAQYSYGAYGTYSATLRVTDNNTPAKTSTTLITVNVSAGKLAPVAVITPDIYRIAQGQNLGLDGSDSYDMDTACGGGIANYLWDIDGDGQFDDAQGMSPTVLWADLAGLAQPASPKTNLPSNTIYLKVIDEFGAENITSATLYIYANRPYAVLGSVNPAGCNEQINIDASASYHGYPQGGNYIQSYEIDFGDGTPVFSGNLQFG
ncbi:MAG: PKD domain-containing protein, partial [Candidatus Auribacterota bacterium]|nr:PKD domain-containing protein [Candidatus Auribacterota bacterium]